MTAIPVSKRGTITLPPAMRRDLGLDTSESPMMLVELRDGGVFLRPAEAMPVRDIPEATLQAWIAEDERDAEAFWQRSGKATCITSTCEIMHVAPHHTLFASLPYVKSCTITLLASLPHVKSCMLRLITLYLHHFQM